MTDTDNATRAPESDAQEDLRASDNVAAGPSAVVGEHCVTDRPTRTSISNRSVFDHILSLSNEGI